MTLHIRLATPGDLPRIDALLRRSYPSLLASDYPKAVLETAIPIMANTPPAFLDEQSYFVAIVNGQICGACGWTRKIPGTTDIAPGRGNIRKLVINKDATRHGLATALMDHTHAHASQAGMTLMHVLSTITAVPFYVAMGYHGDDRVSVPLGPSGVAFDAVAMTRSL